MENKEQRIQIAVQKTGRLTDHSIDLLERCGLKITKSKDQLICYGENMPIDLLLVRDDDIPGLVSEDVCDLGIVGLNVVEEKRVNRNLGRPQGAIQADLRARLRPLPAGPRCAGRHPIFGAKFAGKYKNSNELCRSSQ